ncbi:hypothetical protein D3C76_77510 [compost metagenome]
MFNTLPLKEVPVEVDLGVEASGYTPVYTRYGSTELDMRRVTRLVEGHSVQGIINEDDKTFTIYGVSRNEGSAG